MTIETYHAVNASPPSPPSSSADDEPVVMLVFLPSLFFLMIYLAIAIAMWPYARPRVPFGFILLALLFPPLLPVLLLFLLCVVVDPHPPGAPTQLPAQALIGPVQEALGIHRRAQVREHEDGA